MMQRDRTATAWAAAIVLGYFSLYPLARDVFTARPWLSLGALAIRAFNPQFLFSTSSVNNGVRVTLLGAAMIWWSVRAVTGAGCLAENYVLLGKVRVP